MSLGVLEMNNGATVMAAIVQRSLRIELRYTNPIFNQVIYGDSTVNASAHTRLLLSGSLHSQADKQDAESRMLFRISMLWHLNPEHKPKV